MQSTAAFQTPPSFLNVFAILPQVILLDPMYDCYAPMAARAGAVVVPVKLNLEDWSIPRDALAAAFSPRTKLLLINTPHNPTGKVGDCTVTLPRGLQGHHNQLSRTLVVQVFSRSDLEYAAELLRQHDAYAILDEVYEHLVFEGARHVTLRSLPGMQDRAIRIGSAGKTFSFTGWKASCSAALLWSHLSLETCRSRIW